MRAAEVSRKRAGTTFADNYALGFTQTFGSTVYVSGGGAVASTGAVTLVNATLSGNRVTAAESTEYSGRGAAILAESVRLDQTTALDNDGVAAFEPTALETAARGPVPSLHAASLVTRRSVVISGSGAAVCSPGTQVTSSADSSYNWFADASCALSGAGDQQSTAGLSFAALADNGGLVHTRLPTAGSTLIDYVPVAACPTPTDARGVTRPQGLACDVGAVEVHPARSNSSSM